MFLFTNNFFSLQIILNYGVTIFERIDAYMKLENFVYLRKVLTKEQSTPILV